MAHGPLLQTSVSIFSFDVLGKQWQGILFLRHLASVEAECLSAQRIKPWSLFFFKDTQNLWQW